MMERLGHPGVLLVIIGAVSVYGSTALSRRAKAPERMNLILKGVGCAVAMAGAVWLFLS